MSDQSAFDQEIFGSPTQQALVRRSQALWHLVQDDPRFSYYGRLVGFAEPPDQLERSMLALARAQGAALCYRLPKDQLPSLADRLSDHGLLPDRHEQFMGDISAYEAAKSVLAVHRLPADLTLTWLDGATPAADVAAVAALCEACDVMVVPGQILRGLLRRGGVLVAWDQRRQPVGTASSFIAHHPDSPFSDVAFWGALATAPTRRGEKIALVLGAMMLVHMWENIGARSFTTGVRHDNASSIALCNRLGVADTPWAYAVCLDPDQVGRGQMTK